MEPIEFLSYAEDKTSASPEWTSDCIPYCRHKCPQHDGKRCRITGFSSESICEPVAEEVVKALMLFSLDEIREKEAEKDVWGLSNA